MTPHGVDINRTNDENLVQPVAAKFEKLIGDATVFRSNGSVKPIETTDDAVERVLSEFNLPQLSDVVYTLVKEILAGHSSNAELSFILKGLNRENLTNELGSTVFIEKLYATMQKDNLSS